MCLGEWNGNDADTFLKDAGPLVDEWQNKMALKDPDIKLGIDHGTVLNWYVLTDMPQGVQ